ncbi:putative glycerol kinase 5 [Anoplopoma fimbria]|uniref:putative glycerol kinase 5 n=1 Tax=Anoplopoma fimbria TaxID=229290 RepID=UPI0023EC57F1|nr:putative glycerol kinase 5 [Anoplopoma fimbria]XP_054480894.1 putative glycerol kinase 5 [Anoplopoma fimbria]XP_054480902.1 putative glycerol kinase 5 [Anoplopoma fimbria]XP_054480909.1 putative glycerol kinase 5 [Anoplopoma fimbria]XP_054480917.1 putative glycerol kinase 5 [Anoplopoma fimbria]XP_054480926.1 putative glycerol kinase 5 [Anoplopoma fimbria]XP_054480934.1 putative glycerol kinase 5 [Anoplopoma fimbria]
MGSKRYDFKKESFILSVDVGTTTIRCHVYDKEANVRGSCTTKVFPLYPEVGYVEMDPDAIWEGFISVIKGAVQDAGVQMRQIDAIGISTQRGTFTTWDRKTGVPFHNFISWQDQRAADLVKSWNSSCTMKAVHGAMKVLYFLTRQKRSLAASLIVFSTQHVTFRLVWAITHYNQVRQAVAEGNCCFGTIDTWLLFKLTKGQVHATDYSNASSTGLFDTYQMCWSSFLSFLVSLPPSILPKVENTDHNFGSTDPSIFGVSIPIMSVMADQQAAMFGECCFDVGDVKITMGTGTFMSINTGSKPHTSVAGLYPVVGWKVGLEVVYLAEGNAADTGTAIKWAQELELFSDVQETSDMAYSVSNSDGVCFVPSFSGLQAPLNDPKACASLMGLKPSTTKSHLVRAILESVAFRNKQLYETMLRETRIPITKIRVDGGVSSNNFVMQLTADLFGRKIARPQHFEMSCLGAAFVAGLGIGFWRTREELKKLQSNGNTFLPQAARKGSACSPSREYTPVLQSWERALRRSMNWYKP